MSSSHVGRSSITPTTWPDARMPAPVSPSTSPALSSVGVLAASVIWARVRPWALRMARPSRASCSQPIPLSCLNCRVLRIVGPSRRTALVSSTSSTNGVRSIRCGMPSTFVVTTVPVRSVSR